MVVLFKGIARKLVLPFIALTGVGWLLVVIGFGIATSSDDDRDDLEALGRLPRDEPEIYPLWVVTLSGPFVFAAAIAHAALWKPWSPLAGAVTTFLSAVFLTGLGMILYVLGVFIRELNADLNIPEYVKLVFAGAVLATAFWTPVTILWQFYDGFWVENEDK